MRALGVTLHRIAHALGVHEKTIRDILKR